MADIVRMDSSEVADLETMCARFAPSAKLHRVDPQHFRLRWTSIDIDRTAIVRYTLNAAVSSSIEPEDQLFVCRVEGRTGWSRTGRAEIPKGTPWATDGSVVNGYSEETSEVAAFVFDRLHAQEIARQITGDELLSLRLTSPVPRNRLAGQQWSRAFDYVMQASAAAENDPLIEAGLMRHALVTTLSSFPSTFLTAAERTPHEAGDSAVRRAVSYIDENAHLPITIDDIARAAHISTRGLQYAFRRRLDVTPTEYLRRARLEGAHRDLRRGEATETVATIARRWGFNNASRFASLYQRTFGRSPRQTLERS